MSKQSVVVLGGSGLVGSQLLRRWCDDFELIAPTHAQVDVLDAAALTRFVQQTAAPVIVNLTAWAGVDDAETERGDTSGRVYRLNVDFPRRLAELCGDQHKHLVHISTDYVFDGTKADAPYVESDPTHAVCWYAETKLGGEQSVLTTLPEACVARIEMPFTGRKHPKSDLARTLTNRLRNGQPIQGVTDQRITPVFLDDAADALRCIVEARFSGVIHVAASSWTTPYELALWIARRFELPEDLVQPETFARFSTTRPALRPQHSWLDVSQFSRRFGDGMLRSVEDELDAFAAQLVS